MSGAGKTSFAHRLGRRARPCPVHRHRRDGAGLGRPGGVAGPAGHGVLAPLAGGEPARWRRFDWAAPPGGVGRAPGGVRVVVVEGCCVGVAPRWRATSPILIWLDTPDAERRRRLERREDWDAYAPFFDTLERPGVRAPGRSPHARARRLVVDNGRPDPRRLAGRPLRGPTPPEGSDRACPGPAMTPPPPAGRGRCGQDPGVRELPPRQHGRVELTAKALLDGDEAVVGFLQRHRAGPREVHFDHGGDAARDGDSSHRSGPTGRPPR